MIRGNVTVMNTVKLSAPMSRAASSRLKSIFLRSPLSIM